MRDKGSNTYQEILSQPEVWKKTLNQLSELDVSQWPSGGDFDKILFTGCGSTFYLSIWAARAVQKQAQWCCKSLPASELLLNPENWILDDKKNLAAAVSRSGTTSETIAALKAFNKKGNVDTFGVTCYPESKLPEAANRSMSLYHAQEESIAQTRSFTSMMLGVSYFASRAVPEGLPEQLSSEAEKLFENYSDSISSLGKDLSIKRLFFLGSGPRYGLACEAMLKMKEMSISYSEAYHFMEFRHGPMSMVNEESLVIGLLDQENAGLELDVLKDMEALGARIAAIGSKTHLDANLWIDYRFAIDVEELGMYGDVLYLPLLQLLAYERSMAKGLDPDNPTNLTSVVYVENLNE